MQPTACGFCLRFIAPLLPLRHHFCRYSLPPASFTTVVLTLSYHHLVPMLNVYLQQKAPPFSLCCPAADSSGTFRSRCQLPLACHTHILSLAPQPVLTPFCWHALTHGAPCSRSRVHTNHSTASPPPRPPTQRPYLQSLSVFHAVLGLVCAATACS